jgi:hypothetical protein
MQVIAMDTMMMQIRNAKDTEQWRMIVENVTNVQNKTIKPEAGVEFVTGDIPDLMKYIIV